MYQNVSNCIECINKFYSENVIVSYPAVVKNPESMLFYARMIKLANYHKFSKRVYLQGNFYNLAISNVLQCSIYQMYQNLLTRIYF